MNPIDNSMNVRAPRPDTGAAARRGAGPGPPADGDSRGGQVADPADSSESVSLTRTASSLLALETKLRELPGVDQARVEAVRRAIDEGRYVIDTGRIVNSLLQSERELR